MTAPLVRVTGLDEGIAAALALCDRWEQGVVDTLFTEIRDGGQYSPGTPVGSGRSQAAWEQEGQLGVGHEIRNPLPHMERLEAGSSDQAPQGFVRLAVAAAPLIAEDVARRVVAEGP